MRKHRTHAHQALADLSRAQRRLCRLVDQLGAELETTRGRRRAHRRARLLRTLHGYTWHLQALITGLDGLWPVGDADGWVWAGAERIPHA